MFLWQVRLALFDVNGGNYVCSGSIIDDQFVLTAAHCCDGIVKVDVYISDHNRLEVDASETVVTTTEIYKHPDYPGQNGISNDVCILRYAFCVFVDTNVF